MELFGCFTTDKSKDNIDITKYGTQINLSIPSKLLLLGDMILQKDDEQNKFHNAPVTL